MFIEKDLRKVQEILEDPSDDRKKLKLGRREAQFNGTIEVLTDAKFHDALGNCEYLSLYNNKLHTIRGIEAFQFSPLESLNLGRNELKTLSSGLGKLGHTLQCLWVEDNYIKGFPKVILSLKHLRVLRMCNNPQIGGIPDGIRALPHLEEVAFEGCGISSIPDGLLTLGKLRLLMLRRNQIKDLPEQIGKLGSLQRLHLNDNKLYKLPASIGDLSKLEVLLLNTNELDELPASMARLRNLETLTLSHNQIKSVPPVLLSLWRPSLPAGLREAAEAVTIALSQSSPPGSPGRGAAGRPSGSAAMVGDGSDETPVKAGREFGAGPASGAGAGGDGGGVDDGDSFGAADEAGETLSFDLDFTGNPVWKDPGSLFTLSQYSTPLAMEWSRKRAEAEEAAKVAKQRASKKARVG